VDELARQFGRPDVLFIDVEGFECEVLKGACETLRERPDVFIEVHSGCGLERLGGSREEILDTFPADHYKLFSAVPGSAGFLPLKDTNSLPATRSYLVALNRK
jgi:hypothetical protein